MTEIAIKIVEIRAANNLTQRQLADMLSVTVSTVSRWETGLIKPSKVMMFKIQRMFGAEFEEIKRDKA